MDENEKMQMKHAILHHYLANSAYGISTYIVENVNNWRTSLIALKTDTYRSPLFLPKFTNNDDIQIIIDACTFTHINKPNAIAVILDKKI